MLNSTVKIVDIREEHDMRWKHYLRESLPVRRLKPGEVIVCFNRALTQARIVDHMGGIHDYWSDDLEPFDIEMITEYMQKGINVTLQPGTQRELDRTRRAA